MSFSADAWDATAVIRDRIAQLPLLTELADGSLAAHRFVEYVVQDDFYLRGYARALAMLSSRAPSPRATAFWARAAGEAVAAEVQMHTALLNDPLLQAAPHAPAASPTTRAYVNMLLATAAYEPYPVAAAAVVPCYWVYADVGAALAARASLVSDHPYATWIAAYADPAFQEASRTAVTLLDEAAADADNATRDAMVTAFVDATWYEEQFWAAAYDLEQWPT